MEYMLIYRGNDYLIIINNIFFFCISPVAEDSWVNYVQQVHGVVVHTSHCLRVFKARVYWGAFMLIIIISWGQQCTRDRQGQEGVFGWRR